MFEVPKAAFQVFRKGKAVASPETWRSYAIAVQAIVGLLTAVIGLLRANGYELPITDETLQYLAGSVAGLWFGGVGVYRVITSKDRGLPAKREAVIGNENDGDRE